MARDWKLNINNFAEVEQYYHSIKPVISKNHSKADDIRPLHNRSTKHERIRKISDDIYLLMDGYAYGDDQFHWSWQAPAEMCFTDDSRKQLAAGNGRREPWF